jgi:hypothetical protein
MALSRLLSSGSSLAARAAKAAVARVGLVFGFANAINANQQGDAQAVVRELSSAGSNGAKLVAGALTNLAESGSSTLGNPTRAVKLLTRFAPFLGTAANALATRADWQKRKTWRAWTPYRRGAWTATRAARGPPGWCPTAGG